MDRVLIVIDNIQFSGHLENTLRKVGYITETSQSEYNLSDKLLSFNPDVVVVRGTSTRLSTSNVAKKLKEAHKFHGKVILVFSRANRPDEDQIQKLKSDVVLEEPASALKIAVNILNLEQIDKSVMKEKLYKMTVEDAAFRTEEQSYLVQYGRTVEQEVINVKAHEQEELVRNQLKQLNSKLKLEMQAKASSQRAKIESYNKQIDKIDMDLKKSLNKRKTKEENKENRKIWDISEPESVKDLDLERREFVNELFKKNK